METKAVRRAEGPYGEICAYWLAGRCTRNPCRFLHIKPPTTFHYGRQSRHFAEKTPKYNSNNVSIKKSEGDVTSSSKATQKSSQSICRYWMNGNCIHGDKGWNLHSWFCGEGFSSLAKLHEHKKVVTGIALPVGSDKLFSGSTDGTVRMWDCHTGQCSHVINLGGEVRSLINEGPWVFVGLPNAVRAWNIQTSAELNLDGPKGQVFSIAAGNDTLFAAAKDGVIYAWRGNFETTSSFEPVATLNGHTSAVTCLTVGRHVLYSGSMDGSIKGVLALGGMTDSEGKPVLFCSRNDDSVGSMNCHRRLFSKQEVRTIEVAPGGLFFIGDVTGLLTVWKWSELEEKLASS